jgi:deoxyribodipyrimidine photo-lyase
MPGHARASCQHPLAPPISRAGDGVTRPGDCRPFHAVIFHHDAGAHIRGRAQSTENEGAATAPSDPGTATPVIFWFRRDLRLADNPALLAAIDAARGLGAALLPAYVWEPRERRAWAPGGAARWWLWHSLRSLDAELRRLSSRLVIDRGDPVDRLLALAEETAAVRVVWAEGLEPDENADDDALEAALQARGIEAQVVAQANLLADPLSVHTRDGRPYTVFTPYWRTRLAAGPPDEPLPTARTLPAAPQDPRGLSLADLEPEAVRPWAAGFGDVWEPGEPGAIRRLEGFLGGPLAGYAADRDRPDLDDTSRLSPHLHWGEVTARQVWQAVSGVLAEAGLDLEAAVVPASRDHGAAPGLRRSAGAFLRQLGWREFGHHLLAAFPHTVTQPLHERFAAFPWRHDPAALLAWQRGRTGYPIVDAGMRQLWTTGWLHNRVRLLSGSFLVKDLLLPWQDGAAWFWDTLVDADLANNTLGWQWVSGCGADAAPYFRVFNPVTQGRRYDPDGAYVRHWVPELTGLDRDQIHAPRPASREALFGAAGDPSGTYPPPLVDHAEGRARALAAYEAVRAH